MSNTLYEYYYHTQLLPSIAYTRHCSCRHHCKTSMCLLQLSCITNSTGVSLLELGPAPWHSESSLYMQCCHSLWAPVNFPAVLFLIQLPVTVPGKAAKDGWPQKVSPLQPHEGSQEALGTWFWISSLWPLEKIFLSVSCLVNLPFK